MVKLLETIGFNVATCKSQGDTPASTKGAVTRDEIKELFGLELSY